MRRIIAVVLAAFLGLPLLAATPSTGTRPSVIVYPFTATGSTVDREASSRLATTLATAMAATNQVTVIPPPPGTERKDYLAVARERRADYYVAGFLSPLGNGVSMVEQVVSATTGIVLYSQSVQINTYSEAAGQGDDLANFIWRHANRAYSSIGTPPPQTSPTPAPSSGPEANLGKLFGRKKKPAATPSPKPAAASPAPAASAPAAALVNVTPAPPPATATPRPATPAPTPKPAANDAYAVLTVEGPAEAALREVATQRIVARSNGAHAASAAAACTGHAPRAVLSATLAVRPDTQFGGSSATVELEAADCAGKRLWRQTFTRDAGGTQAPLLATERAVEAAIGAYLNPPPGARR